MAYCLKCGAYIPDGQTVCLACGYDPEAERQAREAEEAAKQSAAASAAQYSSSNAEMRRRMEEQRRRSQEQNRQWAEQEKQRREEQAKRQAENRRWAEEEYNRRQEERNTVRMEKDRARTAGGNKALAALSYLSILFILPHIFTPDDEFARFHAKQGMKLFVFSILCDIAGSFFGLGWIISLARFYLIYKGMSAALAGKKEPLPWIGTLGEKE